jgi:hypothetical protein
VAHQANAMGFIMQNDDDLAAPAVQERLKDNYHQAVRQLITDANQFPNFSTVLRQVEQGKLSYRELALINDVMPNLSQNGLQRLEGDFDRFVQAVRGKALQADVTWQSILSSFLFQPEADSISKFLRERGMKAPEEKLREVRVAVQMNECQFDKDTVNAYLSEE